MDGIPVNATESLTKMMIWDGFLHHHRRKHSQDRNSGANLKKAMVLREHLDPSSSTSAASITIHQIARKFLPEIYKSFILSKSFFSLHTLAFPPLFKDRTQECPHAGMETLASSILLPPFGSSPISLSQELCFRT